MGPRIPSRVDDRRYDPREPRTDLENVVDRLDRLESRLLELVEQLDRTESRLLMVERTLNAVARRTGISIGCACERCEESHLLIDGGMMTCPNCGYRRSV